MTYTIGLEVHIKLNTLTKLFCGCVNSQDFDAISPNTTICPTCTWQPGGLPVVGKEAVEKALLLGQIFSSQVDDILRFDRKSYFYPDLPMGYQITQFHHPILRGGSVDFYINDYNKPVHIQITEAHLENDTAKSLHSSTSTAIDYNRAGTPLIEIVTAPDFHHEDEVVEFLKELQRIVKRNNIGDADLEKGQMRVDVNISVPRTDGSLGTRVEIKNMNSFSAIRRAIQYEYLRQSDCIAQWLPIQPDTVRRDDLSWATFSMRSKENATDYRYFPEPDIAAIDLIQEGLLIPIDSPPTYNWLPPASPPNTSYIRPNDTINHLIFNGIHKETINALISNEQLLRQWYMPLIDEGHSPHTVSKWLIGPLLSQINTTGWTSLLINRDTFESFIEKIEKGNLTEHQAKRLFEYLLIQWWDCETAISKLQLYQHTGDELGQIISSIMDANPKVVAEYHGGKSTAIGFFMWQVMKQVGGTIDPALVRQWCLDALWSSLTL